MGRNYTTANELYEFFASIMDYFDEPVQMYALGGTALTILDIKPSTLDIEVNIDSEKQYKYACTVFLQLGFERQGLRWITQEGLALDVFHGSNIMGTELLQDCLSLSRKVRTFGKITLYVLSPYDIIISKLARGSQRDFEDIRSLFLAEAINLDTLITRYKQTMENSVVALWRRKLLDLLEIKLPEWKIKVNLAILLEVRLWEEQ